MKISKARKTVLAILGAIVLVSVAYFGGVRLLNHMALQRPMNKIIEESAHPQFRIAAKYRSVFHTEILVLDVRVVGGADAAAALLNLVYEYASQVTDKSFETVQVLWRGKPILTVDGAGFKRLGEQYGHSDFMTMTREFATATTLPGGTPLLNIDKQILARLTQLLGKAQAAP